MSHETVPLSLPVKLMSVQIVLHGALEDTAQPLALAHVAHVPARAQ